MHQACARDWEMLDFTSGNLAICSRISKKHLHLYTGLEKKVLKASRGGSSFPKF